jgi:hypothetical protein
MSDSPAATPDRRNKETDLQVPAGGTEKRANWLTEIPAAAKIAGVFIVAAATFFGTKSSLQSDIRDLQRQMPSYQYAQYALQNEQITNLRLIERELTRLEDFVRSYRPPEFVFAQMGTEQAWRALAAPPGPPPTVLPGPGTVEVVVGTVRDAPFPEQFPIEAFTSVVLTQATRSLPPAHSTLIVDLYSVHLAMTNYNHLFLVIDPSARQMPPWYRVRLNVGLPRRTAEFFSANAPAEIDRVRGLLPSLKDRVVAARQSVEEHLQSVK